MPGGYADRSTLAKGPNGRNLCRYCNLEVPRGRVTFCSEWCVHEWRLRTDPGYLRDQVFARDKGVCALCGADTQAAWNHIRRLPWAKRRLALADGAFAAEPAPASGTPTTSSRWWKAAASATSPTSALSA